MTQSLLLRGTGRIMIGSWNARFANALTSRQRRGPLLSFGLVTMPRNGADGVRPGNGAAVSLDDAASALSLPTGARELGRIKHQTTASNMTTTSQWIILRRALAQ